MLNCWFCSVSKTPQSHCQGESSAGVTQKFLAKQNIEAGNNHYLHFTDALNSSLSKKG